MSRADGDPGPRSPVAGDERLDGLRPDQGGVGVDHQHVAVEVLRGNLRQGVARAFGQLLVDDFRPPAEVLRNLRLGGVEHDDDPLDTGPAAGVDDQVEHGLPAHGVEDLRL